MTPRPDPRGRSVRPATAADRADRAELAARLALLAVPRLKQDEVIDLIHAAGSGRGVWDALPDLVSSEVVAAARSEAVRERTRRALHALESQGIRAIAFDDHDYPEQLTLRLGRSRPPMIFTLGDLGMLEPVGVAVVGSRAATEYGLDVAEQIGAGVARAGGCVVSGLALGIDAAAHAAALDAGGCTVGVLACGVDVYYPRRNMQLQSRIGGCGLLLSEQLPGEAPRQYYFPWRNRIIAALSEVVVVVEAGETSGAMSTAGHAADMGVDVLGVPNAIDRPGMQGILRLYGDGVRPYIGVPALLEDCGLADRAAAAEAGGVEVAHPPPGEVQARVWAQLCGTPRHVDRVASAAGLDTRHTLAALLELELDGYAVQLGGGRYVRGRPPVQATARAKAGTTSS